MMNCGLDDVRIRANGDYYCPQCGREFGPGFRDEVSKSLPLSQVERLDMNAPPVKKP